ncbi:MAG TPA: hydrogenase maturation protease [Candidatus Sulfotelmatobacter sp.]|nr:hydrogenase maturation protease [Candidatus Sulfotelmatobacter sp.]
MESQTRSRVVLVAYGNPMRCDDGLAWHVAAEIEKKFSASQIEVVRVHQLAPELAETVSHSEGVIFVDAASGGSAPPGEIQCAPIDAAHDAPHFSHAVSPHAILALARKLFGTSPRAFSVALTGERFDHGESLSPAVVAALPALVSRIEALIREILSAETPQPNNKA